MAVGKPAWYEEGQGGTDLDAMGNDKRRSVIGRQYGASARKRLLVYGIAVTVIVLVVVDFMPNGPTDAIPADEILNR